MEHRLILEARKKCQLTGVVDVVSFDENEVVLETTDGMLTIKGKDMHVSSINLEKQEMDMEGMTDQFIYTEKSSFLKKGENLFSRLFS